MNEKACTRCGVLKPFDAFAERKDRPSGRRSECRECVRDRMREHRQKNPERIREQWRANYHANPEKFKARSAAWKRANREKSRAHSAVEWALKTGRLTRPEHCERCERCGSEGAIHAHHTNYSRRLDVEWLCAACHKREHVASNTTEVAA